MFPWGHLNLKCSRIFGALSFQNVFKWGRRIKKKKDMDVEKKVLKIIKEVETLIPPTLEPNLLPNNLLPNIPEWHSFEHKIWQKGEAIRQLLKGQKKIRTQSNISDKIFEISTNRNAKRGRQSFIMLRGNIDSKKYGARLISQLDDNFVYGHIIDTIYKMKIPEFVEIIKPYCNDKEAWIRNKAKKYIEKYGINEKNRD